MSRDVSVEHLPIFVYGTLKRGEQRETMWPASPVEIEEATTRGSLYDLGAYPALISGEGVIAGELWYVAAADLDVTLAVLDDIECYGNNDVDLYVRRIVDCWTQRGTLQRAYTYLFADPDELVSLPAVAPGSDGTCRWAQS